MVHHDQPFVQQLHDRGLFAQQFAQADLLGDGVGGGLHHAACMVVKTFARDGNVEDAEEIGLGIENGRGGTIPDMIVGAVVFRADKLNGGRTVQAGSVPLVPQMRSEKMKPGIWPGRRCPLLVWTCVCSTTPWLSVREITLFASSTAVKSFAMMTLELSMNSLFAASSSARRASSTRPSGRRSCRTP